MGKSLSQTRATVPGPGAGVQETGDRVQPGGVYVRKRGTGPATA